MKISAVIMLFMGRLNLLVLQAHLGKAFEGLTMFLNQNIGKRNVNIQISPGSFARSPIPPPLPCF